MAEVTVRESKVGGLGVFTVDRIGSGEVIGEFRLEREITAESPLRPELGERPEHRPWIDDCYYLVAIPERYLNHSCDPNIYLRFGGQRIDVVARRDIEPGAELTLDYLINNPGGDSWPCHCGAARCRGGTSNSFFDLPEEFQREYYPLLAPWFLKRYAKRLVHLEAPIGLTPYDVSWPALFDVERRALQDTLGPWLRGPIEHVGSTAVPGLLAKPVIDIMAGVDTLAASRPAIEVLVGLGWVYFPYRTEVMHWFCKPSPQFRTHHLHLVPFGSPLWNDRLAFRDLLRRDPGVAADYAELKRELARRHEFDRESYTEAKGPFVQRVLDRVTR